MFVDFKIENVEVVDQIWELGGVYFIWAFGVPVVICVL